MILGELAWLDPLEAIVYNLLANKTALEFMGEVVSKTEPLFSNSLGSTWLYLPNTWQSKTWYHQLMQENDVSLTLSLFVWLQHKCYYGSMSAEIYTALINKWSIFSRICGSQLQHAPWLPGEPDKTQTAWDHTRVLDSIGPVHGAQEFTFLTRSQETLTMLVWGIHCENY